MKKILIACFIFFILIGGFYYWRQNRVTISVIVPVYNAEKYLNKCLDSIFIQKGSFEVIVVNDGSTDNSLNILEQYAQKHSNLRIITQKNQGVAGARNTGIKAAKNKYLTFVDSDDWLEPDAFKKAINLIKQDKSDVVITGYYDVYDREWVRQTRGEEAALTVPEESKYPSQHLDKLVLFSPFYANEALSDLYYDSGGVRARFFLKSFVNKHKIEFLTELTCAEDGAFLNQVFLNNPFISVLKDPIYNYHNRVDSLSKGEKLLKITLNLLAVFAKTPEFQKASRHVQLSIIDNWMELLFVGIANLQRHGAPKGAGAYELYEALSAFKKFNSAELKATRNYPKIKSYLIQIGFNQPL